MSETPSGLAIGEARDHDSEQRSAISAATHPSRLSRGSDVSHSEASYHWSYTFSGGTLYLDDLIFIENIVQQDGATGVWRLGGTRNLGTIAIEAATLRDLCAERLEVADPRTLAFQYGPRHNFDGSNEGYAWLDMVATQVRGESEVVFEVGGHPLSSPTFGRIVAGLSSRLQAAERRTAVQRGSGVAAFLRRPLTLINALLFVIWVVSIWVPVAPRLTGDEFAYPLSLVADLVPLGALGAWLVLQPVRYRLDYLARWRPAGPLFDLANTRPTGEDTAPSFWRGERGRWWTAAMGCALIGLGGVGASLYLGLAAG